jgi:hypothetical protein
MTQSAIPFITPLQKHLVESLATQHALPVLCTQLLHPSIPRLQVCRMDYNQHSLCADHQSAQRWLRDGYGS